MANETQVTIVGNLTADPELTTLQSGQQVVNLTIASTPRVFDKQANEWKDGETLFMRASAWGEFAALIAEGLRKGQPVIAHGHLVQRKFETDAGTRTVVEMHLSDIGAAIRHFKPNQQRAGVQQRQANQPEAWQPAPHQTPQLQRDYDQDEAYDPELPF